MSTVWDKIYKKFLSDKKNYGCLSGEILPAFTEFVKNSNFPVRSAFDIGCGPGNYLEFLKTEGFKVAGIDSSETAVAMSKALLGESVDIKLSDMYEYDIPVGVYDLIYSILTLHHGTKHQVEGAVKGIFKGLISEGKIFITLPVYASKQDWQEGNEWEYIEDGVIMPNSGPEKGLVHSLFREQEVRDMFEDFSQLQISKNEKKIMWTITALKNKKSQAHG